MGKNITKQIGKLAMNRTTFNAIAIAVFTATSLQAQLVGVNANGTTPEQSVMLDVNPTKINFKRTLRFKRTTFIGELFQLRICEDYHTDCELSRR